MASTAATYDQRLPFLKTAQALTFVNAFVELFILVALITYGVRKKKLGTSWSCHLLICISMPLIYLMNNAVTKTQLVLSVDATKSRLNLSYNTTASNAACDSKNYAGAFTYALSIFVTILLAAKHLQFKHHI